MQLLVIWPWKSFDWIWILQPYWLLDIANVAIVVHLVGAYQVYCQPLFAFVEKWSARKWPKSDFCDSRI
ncbi:hypothetical protein NC653_024017 [Populus alba x Populus x berolinensis]|uniref:Amino acid transporter transmembrane domain-containing protein n=1 Tax=Populus alba x Populus x berolinensis TaxID=444605 RepID=A0AAD6MIU2_9ROSI|nr:hypothetical protein NC653_024017 [Populus alba x Populus x berolinensis]